MKSRKSLAAGIAAGAVLAAAALQLVRVALLSTDATFLENVVTLLVTAVTAIGVYVFMIRPMFRRSRVFREQYERVRRDLGDALVLPGWLWDGGVAVLARFSSIDEAQVPVFVVVAADGGGVRFLAGTGEEVARIGWSDIAGIGIGSRYRGGPTTAQVIEIALVSSSAPLAIFPGIPRGRGFGWLTGEPLSLTVNDLQKMRVGSRDAR